MGGFGGGESVIEACTAIIVLNMIAIKVDGLLTNCVWYNILNWGL
jgi:hypothetical protein